MNTLAFKTKLESNYLQLHNIGNFIGKEVIITIVEIPQTETKKQRQWNFLGAVELNKQLDKVNIRDFAYE